MWTEQAIAQALDGHFYTLVHDIRCRVIDRGKGETDTTRELPTPWSRAELRQLWELKAKGCTMEQIEGEMGRNARSVCQMWGKRRQWRGQVDLPPPPAQPGLDQIRRVVCAAHNIGRLEFISEAQTRKVCQARQIYYWIARKFTTRSSVLIGEYAGGRDHSTVLHGIEKITTNFETYKPIIAMCLFDLNLEMPAEQGREAA